MRQSLYKHKQKCTGIELNIGLPTTINDIEETKDVDKKVLIDILLKDRQQFEKEKDELLKQIETERAQFQQNEEELLKQLEHEKQRKTIETQNNNNNNLNIQINAFGCENLEHITDAFKIKCLHILTIKTPIITIIFILLLLYIIEYENRFNRVRFNWISISL